MSVKDRRWRFCWRLLPKCTGALRVYTVIRNTCKSTSNLFITTSCWTVVPRTVHDSSTFPFIQRQISLNLIGWCSDRRVNGSVSVFQSQRGPTPTCLPDLGRWSVEVSSRTVETRGPGGSRPQNIRVPDPVSIRQDRSNWWRRQKVLIKTNLLFTGLGVDRILSSDKGSL